MQKLGYLEHQHAPTGPAWWSGFTYTTTWVTWSDIQLAILKHEVNRINRHLVDAALAGWKSTGPKPDEIRAELHNARATARDLWVGLGGVAA